MFDFLKFPKQRERPANVAVIDLGTTAAKVAVVDLTTFNPTLVGLGKESYPEGTLLSGLVSNWEQFVATVAGALRQASLPGGFTPNEIAYSLSGEFAKTISVELLIHRPRSGPLIKGEENEIEKEINRLLRLEVAKEYQKITGASREDFKIVEKNRLALTSPKGVFLESLRSVLEPDFKITLVVSFVSNQTERLLKRLTKDLKKSWVATFDQIASVVEFLKNRGPELSAVFLDLGGQVSDVAVVAHGKIVGERTLPLGGRDLDQTIEPTSKTFYGQFFVHALEKALTDILGNLVLPPWDLYYWGAAWSGPGWGATLTSYLEKNPQSLLKNLRAKELEGSLLESLPLLVSEKSLDFEPIFTTAAQLSQKYAARQF